MSILIGDSVDLPIRTISEANRASSEHWRKRWARARSQRETAALLVKASLPYGAWPALHIHLTRHAPGKLDSDNLPGSMKHVRDGIADALGIDDGDERLEWTYAQERTKQGVYFVRVVMNVKNTEAA